MEHLDNTLAGDSGNKAVLDESLKLEDCEMVAVMADNSLKVVGTLDSQSGMMA